MCQLIVYFFIRLAGICIAIIFIASSWSSVRELMNEEMYAKYDVCLYFNGTDNTVPFDVRLYADGKFSVGMFTVFKSWHFKHCKQEYFLLLIVKKTYEHKIYRSILVYLCMQETSMERHYKPKLIT